MRRFCNITLELTCDMDKGTTYLSQTHCAEEILRAYNFWNAGPRLATIQPNTHLSNDDCDKNPARISKNVTVVLSVA